VYAKDGKTFTFTDQAIRVTGRMEVSDYTDEYGYTYNYRIVDAAYETVDLSQVSSDYALWQSIAQDGIVGEVNSLFDYLYFICQWTEYQLTYTDESGQQQTVNMYPGDVEAFLTDDGPNGYAAESAEDYFPNLTARARALSSTGLEDLVEIINQAQQVQTYALEQLRSGEYVYDADNDRFTLNNSEELYNRWYDAYILFSDWLAKWQL